MSLEVDLCVIGGGEAGFAVALAGTALGLTVVLADSSHDDPGWRSWDVALSVLRRAGQRATATGEASDREAQLRLFRADLQGGLSGAGADYRFARLEATNVRVLRGRAAFEDPRTVRVGMETIRARRYVLATGLVREDAPDGTSLTLERLRHAVELDQLVVDGADGRSLALAQGLRRLGVVVVLRGADGLLTGCDPELTAPLRRALVADGVRIDASSPLDGSAASLRYRPPTRAALADLRLDRAGVETLDGALRLSPALRTTNARVYAVGAAAGARSAQAVQAQVSVMLKAALFRLPVRFDASLVPECTVTDPAIATVGLSEADAHQPVTVWRWPFAETVAGAAAGSGGHIKVIVDRRGRVLGAGLVGPDVAEQIGVWSLAVRNRMALPQLADVAMPVPSFGEAARRVALLRAAQQLQNPWLRRAAKMLGRLG